LSYQQFDQLFRKRGERAAVVTHDLIGPLHVIQFCVQLLKEKACGEMPPKYLGHMDSSCQKALELVADLNRYLNTPAATNDSPSLGTVATNAIEVLRTRYFHGRFSDLAITLTPQASAVIPAMSEVAADYVVTTLLSALFKIFRDQGMENPSISIGIDDRGQARLRDLIVVATCGGSPLSRDVIHTKLEPALLPETQCSPDLREGFDPLWLMNRMVERFGARLMTASEAGIPDATAVLRIPVRQEDSHVTG
jgi:hypothetical protein